MKPPAILLACVSLLLLQPVAHGIFQKGRPVPVDRLVKNSERALEKDPNDLVQIYALARVHYLASIYKFTELSADGGESSTADHIVFQEIYSVPLERKQSNEAALEHAIRAAELFRKVLEKSPNDAFANLGYASLLDQFSWRFDKLPPKDVPPAFAKRDQAILRKHYLIAFEKGLPDAMRLDGERGGHDLDFIALEAAKGYLGNESANPTEDEKKTAQRLRELLPKFIPRFEPNSAVTPLIFSFEPTASIASLLAPERIVRFNLRGHGPAEQPWPWLQPATALLVWDPKNEGRIDSGQQLFGNYSWQLFWRDGFAALAALDDNGDGWLRGAELTGLSVWQDRNQNGVSDPGEVAPVSSFHVTGLHCSYSETEGPHLLNRAGVEIAGRDRLPLWDWMATPAKPATSAP